MESSSGMCTFHMTSTCLVIDFLLQYNLGSFFFWKLVWRQWCYQVQQIAISVMELAQCTLHTTSRMLQIFSLKLAKISVECASVELYWYIAVRDELDPLLNYVVNVIRDDPIIVEQMRIHTYLQLFQGKSLVTTPGIGACLLNPLKYRPCI